MKKLYFKNILYVLVFFSSLLLSTGVNAQLGKCKGKYLGNILQSGIGLNYNTYWNQATSENGSKWGSVEGTQGSYNWSNSDIAYNWAKNNNGLFKYHNFVWGSQTPGWVGSASVATLTNSVKNYIAACSSHYTPMGGLKIIDVVNEPVNTALASNYKAALTAGYQAEPANANDKNNQYGWIIWAFQLARKNFPNAQLLINEYNIEMNWNNCRAPYIAMVNAVKNAPNLTDGQKNLIDGVGLQCHGIGSLTAANFKACIDEIFSKTGVPIHITEFDQAADPNEAKQQSVYSTLIPVAWEHPNVAGITIWGYVQGRTWINGNGVTGSGGTDSGIIYASGTERPAMTWLKSYMAGRPNVAGCGTTTNVAPAVSITSPANSATFTAPASITINANASDADGTVSNVQFFNGTTLLGSDATSPYSFVWANVAPGTYTITAKATDNSGAVTTSTAITVVVNAPVNIAPTVSITSPANNATFTSPASITINANAADADGTVSNVQFFNGTTLLGSDASSPYSFVWTNVAAGTYTITAKATDNSGAITTSTAITVVVNGPANIPPAVSITSPLNNASFTSPASVTINATASDADGTVSSVQFFNGSTLLGSDATSPYSFVWTNVAAGTYSITAKATDNSGAVTTSTAVSITVNPPVNNVAPFVSITAPANNDAFTGPATVTITAIASDSDGTVSSVQFFNGTTLLGTDATAPYSFTWTNVGGGTYTITAKATDNSGAVTTSSAVMITVTAAVNQAPSVSITAPANNASFTAPASITITANASDADGTVNSVQFYNGTTLLGTDATSPYSFTWTNVAAGTYSITAKATDNSGAVTTSAAVSITVTAVTVTGDITGPACGAPNSTITFELNANHRTSATNYSWWFQGSTQSIIPVAGTPYRVNIATGQYFTGGQVCIGVNYSVAPYYASYCKTISMCAPSLMAAAAVVEPASIAPNPSAGAFTITVSEDVTSYRLVNDQGLTAYTGGSIPAGGSATFGEQLPSGLYVLVIQYASGRIETLKVQRTL
jgi:GH35 family endo-1,4-beta-xylanase/archaellum component FlaG (FlaF/FlaG flagellin family)